MAPHTETISWLRWLLDRDPESCLLETDAAGIVTHFGPGAEAFFRWPAGEVVGRVRYTVFHDEAELEACRRAPEFLAALERPGWTEDVWKVLPKRGEPFAARVTLIPMRSGESGGEADPHGWIAHYRKIPAANLLE